MEGLTESTTAERLTIVLFVCRQRWQTIPTTIANQCQYINSTLSCATLSYTGPAVHFLDNVYIPSGTIGKHFILSHFHPYVEKQRSMRGCTCIPEPSLLENATSTKNTCAG